MSKEKPGRRISGLEHYSFQDYKKLIWRRRWLILSIGLTVGCVVSAIAYRSPSLYQAKTTIMVDPGKVPDSYVKSTATIDANQRLALLQAQILSTARLGQVIDELHLYERLRATVTRDQIVARMRKDVIVTPVGLSGAKEVLAFEVSYNSHSPMLAAQVADRLAALFIEENMKVREQQVMGTVDFFDHELQTSRQALSQKAEKLANLRAQFFAELPESQGWRTQAVTSLQMELRSEMDAINSAQQQKVYLESLLADSPGIVNLDNAVADTADLEEQLERLQQEMDQLRTRYGPSYPDVVTKAAEIDKLQKDIKKADAANKAQQAVSPVNPKHHNPVIESQIAQIDNEIRDHRIRQESLKSQIEYHQAILEKAPAAEEQLTAANNDYNEAADHLKRLEDHKFSADISSDVETRQKGERFIVLEPALTPDHPYSPNRPLIDLIGLGAGLLAGLFLTVILELVDDTIKTPRELEDLFTAPIMGEIPWSPTSMVRKRWTVGSAFAATANLLMAMVYAGLLARAIG
jgi:polysaccharide chain length determinant protein (PEP-CTERM system associated)